MLKYILFDLDNTLYPKSLGIFDLVIERIRNYMEVCLGFDKNLAQRLRQEYIRQYGSTLRGLMINYQIDPTDYLEYVHDVGVENKLSPQPALARLLESIPLPKGIFTSGHLPHAQKVLRCLGIEKFFDDIFDITFTNYIPKPNPEPYRQILDFLDLPGEYCMMVEDLAPNLFPAKKLGMTTVLVGQDANYIPDFIDYEIENILELGNLFSSLNLIQNFSGQG